MTVLPPMPHDESARIHALHECGILDTPAEEVFDDITDLAARLCGKPVAMIGFMDSNRQWFKAHTGWEIESLPRNLSFCAHTILHPNDLMVIDDTLADSRFANHPLVISQPSIRFYAGAPIIGPDGHAFGTICVFDRVPGQLDRSQRQALRIFARQISAELGRRCGIKDGRRDQKDPTAELKEALAESEERFKDLFEHTSDLIMSIRADGRLLHLNQAAIATLGYSDQWLASKSITDIIPPEARDDFNKVFSSVVLTGKPDTVETTFITASAKRMIVEGGLNPKVMSGKTVLARVIFRDISDRKQIEVELGQARDAALESARLKSQFLTNVTHEIRTPMNGIVGMLGLLLDTQLTAEQRDFAQTAMTSADALLSVIDNILLASKLESGKLSVASSDFDLYRTTDRVVEVMKIAAMDKNLRVRFQFDETLPSVIRGDAGRIRQVLTNLINNAIKFTLEGEIAVKVTREKETDTHQLVRFSVIDTGIGVPKETQTQIFNPFMQSDGSTTRKFGGIGLGLATSRKLVELMGGVMGVESKVNAGSTFWFTIPFEKRAEEKVSTVSTNSFAGTRVLVLDQSETHRRILTHYLVSTWGMKLTAVSNGQEALSALRQAGGAGEPFRIAIFDLHMPTMDGIALAREIKGETGFPPPGLILLTALGVKLDDEVTRAAGISSYLPKPVEQSELFDCLTTVLVRDAIHGTVRPAALPDPARLPFVVPKDIAGKTKVLLAEDNLLNQKVTLSQLRKLGYEAEAVSNGSEVIAALMRDQFGIILMDCQMPVMDGYEATKEIRRREGAGHKTKIIAMTAHALEGDRERCLAAGMDDYLSKPTKQDELAATLARWHRPGH